MIALAAYRAAEESKRCRLCGLPKDVCRDRSIDNKVPVDIERCHVAAAVMRKQAALTQGENPEPYMNSLDFIPKVPLTDLVPEAPEKAESADD